MTSTGLPPGAAVPIPMAPDLDPADVAHVPRWLDELREVERAAKAFLFGPGVVLPRRDPNHARWADG